MGIIPFISLFSAVLGLLLPAGHFLGVVHRLLIAVASLVEEHALECAWT